MAMAVYDDDEGVLRDQGLEVVVIPFRPSPPPRPPRPPLRRNSSSNSPIPNAKNNRTNLNLQRALASPASEESKSSYDDDDDFGDMVEVEGLPSPPPKEALFTPRTQSAMSEAIGQGFEMSPHPPPPPPKPLIAGMHKPTNAKAKDGVKQQKQANKKKASARSTTPGRSHSDVVHSTNTRNSNAANNNTNAKRPTLKPKKSPPRLRSKSTPAKQSSSIKSSTDNGTTKSKNEKPSLYQMAKIGYQELCNAIIRPPRSKYPMEVLGPEEFTFCNNKFVRKDFGVVNERGLLLECSMWKRVYADEEEEEENEQQVNGDANQEPQQKKKTSGDNEKKLNNHNQNEEEEDIRTCGQITLNVDDWDENKERGQMFLHVPESFADSESLSENDTEDEAGFNEGYEGLNEMHELGINGDEQASGNQSTTREEEQQQEEERHQPHFDTTGGQTYYQQQMGNTTTRFLKTTKTKKRRRDPVVIYLHGNSSGRTEAIPQLAHLLTLGVSVVSFDFAGSGKSEGEFVSLGYYEREDLQTVIHHLRASGEVSTIGLWGRSMGAATAIMYGSRDPTISCMVLDSSFTDLTRLAEEMVEKGKEQGVNVPNFVVSVALRMIKSSIKSQAGFSIRHLSPISHVNRCFIPAMFVAGEHDDFINKRHSEQLHAKYAGDKNIVVVDGDHNSPRPRFLLQSACLFLQSCMQLDPSVELVVPLGTNLLIPPWIPPGEVLNRLGLGVAVERARLEAAKKSRGDRCWIPVDDKKTSQQQQPKTSFDDGTLKQRQDQPPGVPVDSRSRSCPSVQSPTSSADAMAKLPPDLPDMSERQKEIQASLFKMLGQQDD